MRISGVGRPEWQNQAVFSDKKFIQKWGHDLILDLGLWRGLVHDLGEAEGCRLAHTVPSETIGVIRDVHGFGVDDADELKK